MNAGRFRLVFDALRGMLVAVGEHTASRRKGMASLGRGSLKTAIARGGRFATCLIAFAAWCAFVWQSGAANAQATLPLSPDRSPGATGPRPAIGVAANGVPIVHIVKPNAAGVSHNRFAQYNVGTAGMVLNNNGLPSSTQTAGWVGGNPFLGNGHARVILNEVTSGNPSRLLGMTEVAGRGASVVVANPAGIYCNGCGFINAPRATLTTGVPVLNGFGALTGLTVMQGALTIDGQGLDARASSRLDLIARAMRINGAIWTQRIEAVAGTNQVDYQQGDATPLTGSGHPPPIVAIDVAALGGMYANAVRLVSSERGVGVHLSGTVNSLTGDIRLSSTGDVTIAQHGSVLAAGHAKLEAASLRHAGAIAANGDVALLASNAIDIDVGGTVTSRTDVTGTAQTISNRGMIAIAGAEQPGNVTLTAANTLRNDGTIDARKDVTLQASTADLSGGTIRAGNRATLTAVGDIRHAQATLDADALEMTAGGALDNTDGKIAGRSATIRAERKLTNDGGAIIADKALGIKAGALSNRQGLIESFAIERATIATTGAFDNHTGTVHSHGALRVESAELKNAEGRLVAMRNLDVHAASVENAHGTLGSVSSHARLNVSGTLDNTDGHIEAWRSLRIDAQRVTNDRGQLIGRTVTVGGATLVSNVGGTIASSRATRIGATNVDNTGGEMSGRKVSINAADTFKNEGNGALVFADKRLDVSAGTLLNRGGKIKSGGTATLRAQGELDNDAGRITARANVDVQSKGELTNRGGTLAANGNADLEAKAIVNDEGLLHAGGTLKIKSDRVTNTNTLSIDKGIEGGRVTIDGDTLNNVEGAIRSDVHAELDVSSLDNTRGTVESTGTARVRAKRDVTNRDGNFNGARGLDIDAHAMTGDGTIQSAGDIDMSLQSDFDHTGTTRSQGKLTFRTSGDLKNGGSMTAGKDANVWARNIENRASGVIVGETGTGVHATQRLTNEGLLNGGDTGIDAPHTRNTGRIYGDTVGVNGDTLTNDMNAQGVAGTIASRGDMDFGVDTLTNRDGGFIYAPGDLRVGRSLDENGRATGEAERVTNDGGTIEAGGNAHYRARRIDNLNSRFASTVETKTEPMDKHYYGRRGSSELMPGESTWFYQVNNRELANGAQDIRRRIGRDYSWYLVGPSRSYSQERFGPPFDFDGTHGGLSSDGIRPKEVAAAGMGMGRRAMALALAYGSTPVGLAYAPSNSRTDPMGEVQNQPERFGYAREDKIWNVFGIAPPQGALPQAPVDHCGGQDIACRKGFLEQQRVYDAKHEAYVAPYREVNHAIRTFNRDFRSRLVQDFTAYTFTSATRTQDTVTASAPGRLITGGALWTTGVVNNDKSQIVAGGDYNGSGPQTINGAALGTRTVMGRGTATYTHKRRHRDWLTPRPVEQVLERETIQLPIIPSSPHAPPVAVRSVPAASDAARGAGASIAGDELNLTDGDASPGHLAEDAVGPGRAPPDRKLGGASAEIGSTAPPARLDAPVIRTMPPPATLPNNALYRPVADPGSRYLIETDPAYTQFNRWISSDTMLQAMSVEPAAILKRIGDGFYEQQLVTQQVMTLTGQRFVGDYRDNQTQYAALLKNGAQAARAFNLTVGTALSEAQMGALSNDIVWLVRQTVRLPDGRIEDVLAPQVYLRGGEADVTGEGTLLAARNISLDSSGEVRNSGTIASRDVMAIDAQNVRNVHGTLAAKTLVARAKVDLEHVAGQIVADHVLLGAGRDVKIGSQTWSMSTVSNRTTGLGALGTIEAGTVGVFAGRDLSVSAAVLAARAHMRLGAGRDLNLGAERTGDSERLTWDSRNNRNTASSVDVGSRFSAGGGLSMVAGRDVEATSAYLSAGQTLTVAAGRDVKLNAGMASQSLEENHYSESRGFLSKKRTVTRDRVASTQALGTTLSGETVTVVAGGDLTAQAASIVGTGDVTLAAGNDLTIGAAQTSSSEYHFQYEKRSGLMSSGGLGFTAGSVEQRVQSDNHAVQQSQARSVVGSVQSNVSIKAGQNVHISGSDVIAGKAMDDLTGATGNIRMVGQNVTIDPGQDEASLREQTEMRSRGLTVGIKGTPLDSIRNVKENASSANAFARAKGVLSELGASTHDVASLSVSYGSSRTSSASELSSLTHVGSAIRGGGNVSVVATGGAVKDAQGHPIDGDITVTGSAISAGGVTLLNANRDVTLQASTDRFRQATQSSISSTGISLAAPSVGDMQRWIDGTANHGGAGPSLYNASRTSANGALAMTQQTPSVVSGENVFVKSGTGDVNIVGSGISGTRGVEVVANQGAINVLAGLETSAGHQESSSRQIGGLGSNGTATGFSVGIAENHSTQDAAAQTRSTMRSQIASASGNVTLEAKKDIAVAGADLMAGGDIELLGENLHLDPATDTAERSMSQHSSQVGVSLALGGAVGNAAAAVNQSMGNPARGGDSRLGALDKAQAALTAYNAAKVARAFDAGKPTAQPLVKATVSIGGSASRGESLDTSLLNAGSTLAAGGDVKLIAAGSGVKDADGFAADGNIAARGTHISGKNVTLEAAREINLQSAKDATQLSSSNRSSGGSIGVGLALGGQQNGFTLELGANMAQGHANGQSMTNRDTTVAASGTLRFKSGWDTNLRGAQAVGHRVVAEAGHDLTIQSQQDTATYESKQTSGGLQASICVPPFCYGQTVSGSGNIGQQNIEASYLSVNAQSGIYAGDGGYEVNVGNHTQLDGGAIVSTAGEDKSSLSTQSFGYTNIENKASYSGDAIGFGASGGVGNSSPGGVNWNTPLVQSGPTGPGPGPVTSNGLAPSGFSAAGTGSEASGTTYATVGPGKITVRGDADTGRDSTAGLNRDPAIANGAVRNTFDAQQVQNDLAVQQAVGQVGMQVIGEAANYLQEKALEAKTEAERAYESAALAQDEAGMAKAKADISAADQKARFWGNDGPGRMGAHSIVSGAAAALGGGNVAGAVVGTMAGDYVGASAGQWADDTLGGTLLANVAVGAAGAATGGAIGGGAGAISGAGGALSADLYNRQLHDEEKRLAKKIASDAKTRGVTNADGSFITVDQIENALRAANNSQYGELVASGVVVPLNADTKTSDLYDTTGMQLKTDGSGHSYLVQDPSMLATPSQTLQDLIVQDTGGAKSPYSWNPPSAQVSATPRLDQYGPFAPARNGCITAECAASVAPVGKINPNGVDYVSVQGNFYIASGGAAINLHNGDAFVTWSLGKPIPTYSVRPGLSVTIGSISGGAGADGTSSFLAGGSGNASFFTPMPGLPAVGVGGGVAHSYGGQTSMEYGFSFPPGAAVNPVGYGFDPKK